MSNDNADANAVPATGLARLRQWTRNPISLVGLALVLVAFGNFLFLFFIDLTSDHPSPYIGILAYMIAPGFMVAGLVLVLFGAWYDNRKRR